MNPPTFEAHGHTWTAHTPGDPMPCDGEAQIYVLFRDPLGGSQGKQENTAAGLDWGIIKHSKKVEIIGWRYADAPTVEPTNFDAVKEAEAKYEASKVETERLRSAYKKTRQTAGIEEDLEEEQDEVFLANAPVDIAHFRSILAACLASMPCGNMATHTAESLPERIAELAKELAEASLENDRMREAINEAHEALMRVCCLEWNDTELKRAALAKLPTFHSGS